MSEATYPNVSCIEAASRMEIAEMEAMIAELEGCAVDEAVFDALDRAEPLIVGAPRGSGRGRALPPPPAPEGPLDLAAATGAVVGGSLVAWSPGLTPEARADGLCSTLLAEAAASREVDRVLEADAWSRAFDDDLSKLGWWVEELAAEQRDGQGTVADFVRREIARATAGDSGPDAEAAAAGVLEAITGLPADDPRAAVLERWSHAGARAAFQLVTLTEESRDLVMSTVKIRFRLDRDVERLLSVDLAGVPVRVARTRRRLNGSQYARIRETVADRALRRAGELLRLVAGKTSPIARATRAVPDWDQVSVTAGNGDLLLDNGTGSGTTSDFACGKFTNGRPIQGDEYSINALQDGEMFPFDWKAKCTFSGETSAFKEVPSTGSGQSSRSST